MPDEVKYYVLQIVAIESICYLFRLSISSLIVVLIDLLILIYMTNYGLWFISSRLAHFSSPELNAHGELIGWYSRRCS